MFWKKKQKQAAESAPQPARAEAASEPRVFDARSGGTFEDVTSQEAAEAAVEQGRLQWVYIVDPMFGGAEGRVNQVPAPPGVQGALDQINEILVEAIQSGQEVGLDFDAEYKGDSFVPASLTYDCGDAGVFQVLIW
ncbi:MAG: hypothetical protein Q4G64_02390 [bacterium]|nr:hypothetical protein [bacterium]